MEHSNENWNRVTGNITACKRSGLRGWVSVVEAAISYTFIVEGPSGFNFCMIGGGKG